jgi:formiminotetrahydrofolate cyclodeaminase
MVTDNSLNGFIDDLSSAAPVPGGGGASALVGAVGNALGSMVANLTLGKKKYAAVQDEIKDILSKAQAIRKELFMLAEKDAEAFQPLSKAYGLPKDTEDERKTKEAVLEQALKNASVPPLEIMIKMLEAIDLLEILTEKGTKIAVSDVGAGVQFCKAALYGAALNVFINTKLMKDRDYAKKLNAKAESLIRYGSEKADEVYKKVEAQIK